MHCWELVCLYLLKTHHFSLLLVRLLSPWHCFCIDHLVVVVVVRDGISVAETDPELLVLLPSPAWCWGYWRIPPSPADAVLGRSDRKTTLGRWFSPSMGSRDWSATSGCPLRPLAGPLSFCLISFLAFFTYILCPLSPFIYSGCWNLRPLKCWTHTLPRAKALAF